MTSLIHKIIFLKGSDETEAKRIRRYLVNEGLPSQDILLEEKATTTVTMATFCK